MGFSRVDAEKALKECGQVLTRPSNPNPNPISLTLALSLTQTYSITQT